MRIRARFGPFTHFAAVAMFAAAAVLFGLLTAQAHASPQTSTAHIESFDQSAPRPAGYPHGAQVVKLDEDGNALDAKSDFITYFEGSYYLYGESYGCAYAFSPTPSFCGFGVYRSEDLVHWTSMGKILDPATSQLAEEDCSAISCWGPVVVRNPTTHKYLLWFYRAIGAPTTQPLVVLEGSSPTGPWTNPSYPNVPTGFAQDIYVDQDGSAYLSWGGPSTGIHVQKLNSTYTDVVGPATTVTLPGGSIGSPKCQPPGGLTGPEFENQNPELLAAWKSCGLTESPSMTRNGNKYYLTFSNPICAFCLGTETAYFVAENPLGPWYGAGGTPSYNPAEPGKFVGYTLSADTCGGQPFHIAHLPTSGGATVDLFAAVQWENSKNEGSANHYWEPLRFKHGLLEPLRCDNANVPLAHRVEAGESPPLAINLAAVGAGTSLAQTFKATATGTIRSIELPLYKKTNPSKVFGEEGLVSSPLTLELSAPGGSATVSLSPEEVSWTPTRVTLQTIVPVRKGDTLTLSLNSATPAGRYATLFEDRNPYPGGRLTGSGEAASLVSPSSDILFKALESTSRGTVVIG